jgi:hypothetical protein
MFAQLLQNLGSYLDFSKRLATTIPGLVLALALVMLTASAPDWVQQPFACGEVQSLAEQWNDAEHKLETTGSDAYLMRVLRAKESALRRAYYGAVSGAVSGAEASAARADAANTALQTLSTFYGAEGKVLLQQREKLQDEQKAADAALADADRKLAENRYGPLCSKHFDWSKIASDLLMFGLLGFTLGVVFDPVNKAIFLQKLPEMVAAQEDSKSEDSRAKKFFHASNPARLFVPKGHAEKRVTEHLKEHSAQFYIGRGLITPGEYQDRIDQFYRFCEVTTGLVIPVALIGIALMQHYRSQGSWIKAGASVVLGVGGSVFLSRVGIRRYGEFRTAVSDLIGGRLAQVEEAKRKQETAKVDLLQLQTLVHKADEIMHWWARHGGSGK